MDSTPGEPRTDRPGDAIAPSRGREWILPFLAGCACGAILTTMVLAVVASILMVESREDPRVRKEGRIAACASNLRQIGLAASTYLNKYGAFPFAGSGPDEEPLPAHRHLQLFYDKGMLDDLQVVICPASGETPAEPSPSGAIILGPGTCSFLWTAEPHDATSAATIPLAADAHPHDGVRNVLLLGGEVKTVPEVEFREKYAGRLTGE